ncbi:twin-arginine translocase subunit TatC [Aliibacillus thermotolerans]|uniref:Sec-independent protein translocase protein TatC n=1 Tax=Aliibacillus thermotolerans TaxID=1834418 RepID=A0ABW0U280_9BACI|nr:twin-arginine translocase subunit TatC [Aliibacillus thermotolerans]MDA3128707.1 twin-arginine translocase subunit TatC [Aliibacillus thermotolerans]
MDKELTTVEHLTELRHVVISSSIIFIVSFIVMICFIQQITPFLTKGEMLTMLGPLEVVRFYTGVAGSLSLGVSAPFIGFQLWRFIKPALTTTESKAALRYIPAMFFSFLAGTSFGFFVVFPFVYQFLIHLGELHFHMLITTKEYFSFLLMSTIPLGFLFEVPFALMFLTVIGIVTPNDLKKTRKYGYLLLAIVSALITPPDFVSQIIVLIPLMLLYEIGLYCSKHIYAKHMRHESQAN